MKVKELIEQLNRIDGDREVLVGLGDSQGRSSVMRVDIEKSSYIFGNDGGVDGLAAPSVVLWFQGPVQSIAPSDAGGRGRSWI